MGTPARGQRPGCAGRDPRQAGWRIAVLAALATVAGCAADPGERLPDGGATPDAATDFPADRPPGAVADVPTDGFAPGPDVPGQVEPPLVVRTCVAGGADVCCSSALDFDDGSTEHFLAATCCRMALSSPQVAATPTACGRGALKLNADFRATDASSMCGSPGESPACASTAGEITRAILAPLNLAGRTLSVMAYLDGPALPPGPVHGRLFVVGPAGRVEGPERAMARTETWLPVEMTVPVGGAGGAGTDVQLLGIRFDFHGQAWSGQLFLDDVTWR